MARPGKEIMQARTGGLGLPSLYRPVTDFCIVCIVSIRTKVPLSYIHLCQMGIRHLDGRQISQ
jgi:hypothetical protein